MKLIINKDRSVIPVGTWGTVNENDYEILEFEFPAELEEYNKRIVYYLDDERVWDTIVNNKAYITNAITTKGDVKAYVWCTKENTEREADTDFRTMLFEMHFYENENADGIVPTEEQVDGFNTMLTAMNNKIDEVDALETTIETAEAQRQEAEATRVSNESTRESNESTRQTNEQTRQTQEADRERRTDEAIADIEDKTAEYNANAEEKTNEFNDLVDAQKVSIENYGNTQLNAIGRKGQQALGSITTTTQFALQNISAAQQTGVSAVETASSEATTNFNTNATNKTNAFNSNATEKTTTFDNNASTKTSAFNDNATSKTNDFNDNATEKTTAYNTNAQNKIDEYDEHIVEYQAQIDELQEEVEELSENMPWSETEQATEIDITDAAKYSKNKMKVFGNTEQTQYSGKNLLKPGTTKTENGITFSVQEDGTIIANGTATANASINLGTKDGSLVDLPAGTYTISGCPSNGSSTTYRMGVNLGGGNIFDYGNGVTTTLASDVTDKRIWCIVYSGVTVNNLVFKPMLEIGDAKTDYEPYVGGVPSPNPDHPQPIHVVTGNNTISVQGKNYVALNREGLETTHSYTHNYDSFSFSTKQYTKLPAGSYTMMFKLKSSDNGKFNKVQLKGPNNSDITVLTLYRTIPSNYTEYVKTFTIAQPTEIRGIFTQNAEGTGTFTFKDIMVVAGTYTSSNVPEYDIYRNTNYPLNLGSLELCKIGNYQDYLYKENGNWYKYGAIDKYIFSGTETYYLLERTGVNVLQQRSVINNKVNKTRSMINIIASHFVGIKDNDGNIPETIRVDGSGQVDFTITNTNPISVSTEAFKTWLNTHNVTSYYLLATPTTTQITDETLIAQLEAIYNHLALVKGTNNITVTASDLAPYMELSYMQDLKSKLDNLDSRLALLE